MFDVGHEHRKDVRHGSQVQIFDDDKVLEFIFSKQVIDDRVELAIQSVDLESGLGHLEGKIGGEVVQRFCFGGRDIDDFETAFARRNGLVSVEQSQQLTVVVGVFEGDFGNTGKDIPAGELESSLVMSNFSKNLASFLASPSWNSLMGLAP